MKTILTKFSALFKKAPQPNFLADLLKDPRIKESLLGVDRFRPMTDEDIRSDASRIINYARTEDYSIYAQKLWQTVVFYVKCLSDVNLKPSEVDFYRGCLKATMEDLKISYEAFRFMEGEKKNPVKGDSPTPGRY